MDVGNYIKEKSKIKVARIKNNTMPIGRIQHLAITIT